MKTICIKREVAFEYGFNKVLDEVKKHQEKSQTLLIDDIFSGLYIKPNLYKTIIDADDYNIIFTDKKEKDTFCDIYISDKLLDMNGKSSLKILYVGNELESNRLIEIDNIYVIKDWSNLKDILDFYEDYNIRTLEKEEK